VPVTSRRRCAWPGRGRWRAGGAGRRHGRCWRVFEEAFGKQGVPLRAATKNRLEQALTRLLLAIFSQPIRTAWRDSSTAVSLPTFVNRAGRAARPIAQPAQLGQKAFAAGFRAQ